MPYKNKEDEKECRKRNRHKWKEYHQDYFLKNREKITSQARLKFVQRQYNLDADTYLGMILNQDNKCLICKQPETGKTQYGDVKPLSVDHCHETGLVRGLLCNQCNAGLGNFKDDINKLKAAVLYLEQFKEK